MAQARPARRRRLRKLASPSVSWPACSYCAMTHCSIAASHLSFIACVPVMMAPRYTPGVIVMLPRHSSSASLAFVAFAAIGPSLHLRWPGRTAAPYLSECSKPPPSHTGRNFLVSARLWRLICYRSIRIRRRHYRDIDFKVSHRRGYLVERYIL